VSRFAASVLFLLLCAAPHRTLACTGDCDGGGLVTIAELIQGVAMALGNAAVSLCPAIDADGSGNVTIDELVAAVGAALDGCPATATPVPGTPTVEPSATEPEPTAAPTETAIGEPSPSPTGAPRAPFCDLPGSLRFTADGQVLVPGGAPETPDLSFLHLPAGFCAHYYGRVGNARQLRFAPNGELFVASPSTLTTGGRGDQGLDAVVILPDDDGDGVADQTITFLEDLPATQGLLFANGYFYFQQDLIKIMRVPYTAGDREPSGAREQVVEISRATGRFQDQLHWPKVLDIADDGTMYVTNGGSQSESCDPEHPFRGGILRIDGTPGGAEVAKGFRNPIAIRCARGHNRCFAVELARDYTAAQGGREKLVPVRQGDDWGHPCCATANQPFPAIMPVPDCSGVATEGGAFIVGHTPFDLDFETGKWPAPWNHRVYVPLHGVFGTWEGARLITIGMDPATGEIIAGSELQGEESGSFSVFASGWDDGTRTHGRPANVAFAPDGRLFLGNDNNGDIIWIAPLEL